LGVNPSPFKGPEKKRNQGKSKVRGENEKLRHQIIENRAENPLFLLVKTPSKYLTCIRLSAPVFCSQLKAQARSRKPAVFL